MSNETALLKVKEILSCLESLSRYSSLESPEDMSAVLELFQKISWRSSEIPSKDKFHDGLKGSLALLKDSWVLLDFLAETMVAIRAADSKEQQCLLQSLLEACQQLRNLFLDYQFFLENGVVRQGCEEASPAFNKVVGHFLDQHLIYKIDRAIQDLEAVTDQQFRAVSVLRVIEIIGEAVSQMSHSLRALGDFPFWAVPTAGGNKSLAHDLRNLIQHHRRELSFMEKLGLVCYEGFIVQCEEYLSVVQKHVKKIKKYSAEKRLDFSQHRKTEEVFCNYWSKFKSEATDNVFFHTLSEFFKVLSEDFKKQGKEESLHRRPNFLDIKESLGLNLQGFESRSEEVERWGRIKKLVTDLFSCQARPVNFTNIKDYLSEVFLEKDICDELESLWRAKAYCLESVQDERVVDELEKLVSPPIFNHISSMLDRLKGSNFFKIKKNLEVWLLGPKELLVEFFKNNKAPSVNVMRNHFLVVFKEYECFPSMIDEAVSFFESLIAKAASNKKNKAKEVVNEQEVVSFLKKHMVVCQEMRRFLGLLDRHLYLSHGAKAIDHCLDQLTPSRKLSALEVFMKTSFPPLRQKDNEVKSGDENKNKDEKWKAAEKVFQIFKEYFFQEFSEVDEKFRRVNLDMLRESHFLRVLQESISVAFKSLDEVVKVGDWEQVRFAAEFFMEEAGALAENFYKDHKPSDSEIVELSPRYFGVLAQFRKKMAHHYQGVDSLELRHLLEKSCLITGPLLQGLDMKPGEAVKPLELIDAKDQIIGMILSFGFGFNIRIIGSRAACDFGVQADLNLLVEEIDTESSASAGLLMELSMALSHFLNRDVQVFTEASLRESYKTKVSQAQINCLVSKVIDFEEYFESLRFEKIIKEASAYSNIRMHDGTVLTCRDMQNAVVIKEILQYLFPGREAFSGLFDAEDFQGRLEQALSQRLNEYEASPDDHKAGLLKFFDDFLNRLVFKIKFKCLPLALRIPGQQAIQFPHFYGKDLSGLPYRVCDSQVFNTIAALESRGGHDFFYDCYLPAPDANGVITHYTLFSVSINQNRENIKTGRVLNHKKSFIDYFFRIVSGLAPILKSMMLMLEPDFGRHILSVEYLDSLENLQSETVKTADFREKRFLEREDLQAIVRGKADDYLKGVLLQLSKISDGAQRKALLELVVIYKKIEKHLKYFFDQNQTELVSDYFKMSDIERPVLAALLVNRQSFLRPISCSESFVRYAFLHPHIASHALIEEVDRLYAEFLVLFKKLADTFLTVLCRREVSKNFILGCESPEFNEFFDSLGNGSQLISYDRRQAYELFTKFRAIFSCIEDPEVLEALKDDLEAQEVLSRIQDDFKRAYCSNQSALYFNVGGITRRKRCFSDEVEYELYEQQRLFVLGQLELRPVGILKRLLENDITLFLENTSAASPSCLRIHSVVGGILGFNAELDRRLNTIHQQVIMHIELKIKGNEISTEAWPQFAFDHVDPAIIFEHEIHGKSRYRHTDINTLDDLLKFYSHPQSENDSANIIADHYKFSDFHNQFSDSDRAIVKDYYEYRKQYDQLSAVLNRIRQYVSTRETLQKARYAQADMELKEIVAERIADIQSRCQADLKEYGAIEERIMGLDYTKKRILLLLQQKPIFEQIERLFAEQPDHHEALFAGFVAQVQWLIRRELDKPEGSDQLSVCEKARLFMPRQPFRISSCDAAMFSSVLETLPCALELRKTL